MCRVSGELSIIEKKQPLSWFSDTLLQMCAHPVTRGVILWRKPHPSGAQVDLNKPHQASSKHCLSQVWRWSPDDAPSADRHDKQFPNERRRPFGSYLDKVLLWAKQQKIFTVMYNLIEKEACELQEN